ncbi:PucR family transcriptional regulator [Cohnella sp.]|uniref:PucR family transcriptional regulator n=1 Tax=Cohnella sp. TaxID=1883426 RepID=UPI003568E1F5
MALVPSKQTLSGIQSEETSQLEELQKRIQSMSRLLLEGRGLYAFLDAMEDMLGNHVAIVRESGRPWLSRSLRGMEQAELRALLQSLSFQQVGQVSQNGFMLLPNEFRIYVKLIPIQGLKKSNLVLLELNGEIKPADELCVNRLSTLVGLELANIDAIGEVEGKYLDHFLQDWLTGKIISEADWKLRADVCGYAIPEQSLICAMLVEWSIPKQRDKLREIASRLRSERLHSVEGMLATPIGDDLALVLPIRANSLAESEGGETFTHLLSSLLKELQSLLGDPEIKLYVGRTNDRSEGLHHSWSQAKRARHAAHVCGLQGEVVAYDRLGVYSLLYLIPTGDEREQFLRRFLFPIQQADRKGGGRLMETLEMFFFCNGNIKLTSEKLYAHYNTIVYRLEKVQTILGLSLDDPEDRLQLHLALKLGQITPGSFGQGQ